MKIENVVVLRDELSEMLMKLKGGKEKHYIAKEFFNGAGKMINSAKVELEHAMARKEKPAIPFLMPDYSGR